MKKQKFIGHKKLVGSKNSITAKLSPRKSIFKEKREAFFISFDGIFGILRGISKCVCICSTNSRRASKDILRIPDWETKMCTPYSRVTAAEYVGTLLQWRFFADS